MKRSTPPGAMHDAAQDQESDQVEPMHRGARAEADDYSGGRRETDSDRGTSGSEEGESVSPGGTTGEHSGQILQPEGEIENDRR